MTKTSKLINQLPAFLLYLIIFLIPIAFWPSQYVLAGAAKKYLFIGLVIALAVAWWFSKSKSPTVSLPSKWWLATLWFLPLAAVISGLLSGSPHHSLISLGVENDTAWAFFGWALFATVAAVIWLNRRAAGLYTVAAVLAVGLVVGLFQWIRLLAGNFTYLAVFANPAANLIGKWNEFGLFMGLMVVLSLAFLEFFPWRRLPLLAGLAWSGLILGLASLILINYWYGWVLIGLAALLIVVTNWSKNRRGLDGQSPWPIYRYLFTRPMLVATLALILLLIGNQTFWPSLAGRVGLADTLVKVSDQLGVQVLEVSPSWVGTGQVIWNTLKNDPLVGVGPNNFSSAWFKYRPIDVNTSPFWSLGFDYGIGFWPSLAATMGILGIVAILLILGAIGYLLSRVLFVIKAQTDTAWPPAVVIALGAVYLLGTSVFYPVGTVVLVYLFAFLALLIASATTIGLVSPWEIGWAKADGTLALWRLVIAGIIGAAAVLLLVQSLLAAFYFNRALAAVNRDGNLEKGEVFLAQAAGINHHDLFYRSLVDVELSFLASLLQNQNLEPAEAQTRFQNTFTALADNSRRAVNYNSTNYLNWQYQGRVFESVAPLGVDGAYEAAFSAYGRARIESGDLPSILLNLARLEITAGDIAQAKNYLTEALTKKPNYTEAIFVLAQIEAETGNLGSAIDLADTAAGADPGNPTTFFTVGLLKYQAGDYRGAVTALEQAINLDPTYANARYFLGLTYDQLNRSTEALEQFEIILTTNDLLEIRQIIANLKAGRAALIDTEPPLPEDRAELPVADES